MVQGKTFKNPSKKFLKNFRKFKYVRNRKIFKKRRN